MQAHTAALRHLEAVAQQGKARHVGAAVDAVLDHDVPGRLVQRGHLAVDALHHLIRHQIRLGGGGQHAHAPAASSAAARRRDVRRCWSGSSADGRSRTRPDRRWAPRLDGVAAGDDGPGLVGLVVAAPQQLLHRVLRHGLRQAQDGSGPALARRPWRIRR